jgi:hypothetical protein
MPPGLLFGWIPNPLFLIGIIALIYQVLALWVMMDVSKSRAVLIAILWLILLAVVQDLSLLVFEYFIIL